MKVNFLVGNKEDKKQIPVQIAPGRASALIYSFILLNKLKSFVSSQPNFVISLAYQKDGSTACPFLFWDSVPDHGASLQPYVLMDNDSLPDQSLICFIRKCNVILPG